MDTELIIKLVLIAVGVIFGIVVFVKIKRAVNRSIRKASKLLSQINAATEEAAYTPRTVSGSEGIFRERIRRDFPEFDVEAARQIVTGVVSKYFVILNNRTGTDEIEKHCTASFINELEAVLMNENKTYKNPLVHKTVISDYRKRSDEAVITFQSAVQYQFEGKMMSQHVYEVKYIYYLAEGGNGEGASLICPHCGGEISSFGEKYCEYCGAAVQASVERTWKVNNIIKSR